MGQVVDWEATHHGIWVDGVDCASTQMQKLGGWPVPGRFRTIEQGQPPRANISIFGRCSVAAARRSE